MNTIQSLTIFYSHIHLFNADWRADSYRSWRHFNNGFQKWIIYRREDNPVHTPRKDKQAIRNKKKRTLFLFKDKENINYSNYFNNAKPGWRIFPVITDFLIAFQTNSLQGDMVVQKWYRVKRLIQILFPFRVYGHISRPQHAVVQAFLAFLACFVKTKFGFHVN